ncbi:MAG TPA: CoA-transferase [Acidimicrobiia bacterium]|nr:CoA-transferase [Acidimicrobiia bacterium]
MADKRATEDEVVGELRDGMTVGIGGWGSRRKPMSIVRAIARSDLRDLTIVSCGGPDVGLLCATGKVAEVVFAFVSLDSIPLEPHFRAAVESRSIRTVQHDEGTFFLGLQAAAWRVPFLPTRVGLGSDLFRAHPRLRTVRSPYDDGEELVAAPAIELDAAVVHLNRGDERGNGQILGVDPFMDDLMLRAARRRFMSVERLVPTDDFLTEGPVESLRVPRHLTDAVVEAPRGAHFTSCPPDYERDESFQREYAATAKSPEAWDAFRTKYIDVPTHAGYLEQVGLS